jgi:hypothetical protein
MGITATCTHRGREFSFFQLHNAGPADADRCLHCARGAVDLSSSPAGTTTCHREHGRVVAPTPPARHRPACCDACGLGYLRCGDCNPSIDQQLTRVSYPPIAADPAPQSSNGRIAA